MSNQGLIQDSSNPCTTARSDASAFADSASYKAVCHTAHVAEPSRNGPSQSPTHGVGCRARTYGPARSVIGFARVEPRSRAQRARRRCAFNSYSLFGIRGPFGTWTAQWPVRVASGSASGLWPARPVTHVGQKKCEKCGARAVAGIIVAGRTPTLHSPRSDAETYLTLFTVSRIHSCFAFGQQCHYVNQSSM